MQGTWQRTDTRLPALATLSTSDAWAWHANLGTARQAADGAQATLLDLAVVWTPQGRGLLFAEMQANDRRDALGGTVHAVGGRWWLMKDRLGLDLSTHREAGGLVRGAGLTTASSPAGAPRRTPSTGGRSPGACRPAWC
jgi:hypothetical protein